MYETLTRYGMSIKFQRPEERDFAGRGAVLHGCASYQAAKRIL
jgi:hypothetical protein